MATRLIAIALALLLALPAHAQVVTSSTAETYRRAAEKWKGIALEEQARRRAAEHEAKELGELRDYWKDAAVSKREPMTLDWIWPTSAVVVLAAFAAGFALGWKRSE